MCHTELVEVHGVSPITNNQYTNNQYTVNQYQINQHSVKRRYSLPTGTDILPKAKVDYHKPTYAMTLPEEDLQAEIQRRQGRKEFPMDVFPEAIRPYLNYLLVDCGAYPGHVGLTLMCAASTAIGSGLRGRMATMEEKVVLYGVIVGGTSSGKSVAFSNLYKPIREIQKTLDKHNAAIENGRVDNDDPIHIDNLSDIAVAPDGHLTNSPTGGRGAKGPKRDWQDYEEHSKRAIMTEDTTLGSFMELLQQNPKGVSKVYDELSTFFDDMEKFQVNKGEDKFWIKIWNSNTDHRISRKGKADVIIPAETLFANIYGGTQPAFLKLFFQKNRYESGFSSRFLFSMPPKYEIMDVDPFLDFPQAAYEPYAKLMHCLHDTYSVLLHGTQPPVAVFSRASTEVFQAWNKKKLADVNNIADEGTKNAKAGVYGKMKQYIIRFATILKAMHMAATETWYKMDFKTIEPEYVTMACRIADYFYDQNFLAYEMVYQSSVVPSDVMEFYGVYKRFQFNQTDLANHYGVSRNTIRTRLKKFLKEYPKLFGSGNN